MLNEQDKKEEKKILKAKVLKMTDSQKFIYIVKDKLKKNQQVLLHKKKVEYYQSLKKERYRYKDMEHPEYKENNIYKMYYYKNYMLSRCINGMRVKQAWNGLEKSWNGFYACYANKNIEGMLFFAKGIQRFCYLLELPPIHDFRQLGLKPYTYKDELALY